VLDNFAPKQDLILIKTKHPRLEVTKVVAGMSGSPIYINGKMVGAYAYGWTFGVEPVAGVTPIANMLSELARPLPKQINGWPLALLPAPPAGNKHAARDTSSDLRWAGTGRYDLARHAQAIATSHALQTPQGSLVPVATPLLLGGMSPGAVALAKDMLTPLGLEPLQAGGGGKPDPNAPTRFEDGGAIGVQLVRGDMSAMGLGTVTRVEGDKLVAFGHPMMQSGVTSLPTAVGKVLWFLASDMRSFKIGTAVRNVGALVNDRAAAIVVSHSAKPPVIPVTLKIKGTPGEPVATWNFEIAEEKFMTPTFMAVALGSALQTTASERQDVSWSAKSHLVIKGHGAIDLEDFGVSVGGTPEARDFINSNLVNAVGGLMNNPWETVLIERADMEMTLEFAREILRLRGAEVLDPEVEAGKPVRIRVTLVPYSGPAVTRVISVPIPAYLAGQTLTLELKPGYTEERDVSDPETLDAFIANLVNPTYPPKSLVVTYTPGSGAVSFKGHVASNLPPGALDALRPTSSSVAPDAFKSELRQVIPLDQYLTGEDKVTVTIKPVLR
jgi:hypothetical protein